METIAINAAFRAEVVSRFGVLPNFFLSAADAPGLTERLWSFCKDAYLDSPMPPEFKERLFVYLSRFCAERYCVVRHCAFLMGYGHASGDPSAAAQTANQALQLVKTSPAWRRDMTIVFEALEGRATPIDWAESGSWLEECIFAAASAVFAQPARAERERMALRKALGGKNFELLLALLTFIRAAHYWTMTHPDLTFEDDVVAMLTLNDGLATLLLDDPEAGHSELGARLLHELVGLRSLAPAV